MSLFFVLFLLLFFSLVFVSVVSVFAFKMAPILFFSFLYFFFVFPMLSGCFFVFVPFLVFLFCLCPSCLIFSF